MGKNKLEVVAAVIYQNGLILTTQRGYGDYKDKWEFPGGRIQDGETPETALAREIKEELDVSVVVGRHIETVEYDYPEFHLSMKCFWCEIETGQPTLKEHEALRWLSANDIYAVDWLPADKLVLPTIREQMREWE